jgi:hypothetical protein
MTEFVFDSVRYSVNTSVPSNGAFVINSDSPPSNWDLVIPATVIYNSVTYDVKKLNDSAFVTLVNIKNITIPNSVTEIGISSFQGSGLTNIVSFGGVTKLNRFSFSGTSLRSLTFPIDRDFTFFHENPSCFSGCGFLTSVTYGSMISSIPNFMFEGCTALASFTNYGGLTAIGAQAFYNCNLNQEFIISDSVTYLAGGALAISGITKVTIGSQITSIGAYTFQTTQNRLLNAIFNGTDIPTISSTSNFQLTGDTAYYRPGTTNVSRLTPFFTNVVEGLPGDFSAPQNVTSVAGNQTATISWSAVTDSAPDTITKYQISYYNTLIPSSITTVDVSGNLTQKIIYGLTNDQTYSFSVKAYVNDIFSVASSSVTATPFVLSTSTVITATAGISSATINWSAVTVPSPNSITKYQISYYIASDSSGVYNDTINITQPWLGKTGISDRNIALALTADETRAIRAAFDNSLIYLSSYNTNTSTWTGFTPITDNVNRNYSGLALTGDGSRGVACCGITGAGYIYIFTWNGSTYSTLTQILDTTARDYHGISLSDDGSILVVSSSTGVYFATWNGTNYSVLTKTLESRNVDFIGANISRDGLRIVYGANDLVQKAGYWADWNGTNFNNGTIISANTPVARCLYFADDKKIIWLSGGNYGTSNPFLYFSTWNGTGYNPFISLPLSSVGEIDGWGLWVNNLGNNIYLASYFTYLYYKFNLPLVNQYVTVNVDVSGNITEKVITGLSSDKTYSFSVKAYVNDLSSEASSIVTATPYSIDAPQNVTGTAGINSATINWSAVTSSTTITKYQISYYDTLTPSSITTVDVSANLTQKVITGLTNGQTYGFSVKAYVNDLSSEASSIVTATPYSIDAPQNVTGTAGISAVTINWSAVTSSTTITKYQISYYDTLTPSSITTVDVSANLTQKIISGLTNGQTYSFSVKAYVNDLSSEASSIVTATPYSIPTISDITRKIGIKKATISWPAVSILSPNTITKYQISYYNASTPSSVTTVDVSGNLTEKEITGLTIRHSYGFSVKAFVNSLSSEASNTETFELSLHNVLNDNQPYAPLFFYEIITNGYTTQEMLSEGIDIIAVTNGEELTNLLENYDFPRVNLLNNITIPSGTLQANSAAISISNLSGSNILITDN